MKIHWQKIRTETIKIPQKMSFWKICQGKSGKRAQIRNLIEKNQDFFKTIAIGCEFVQYNIY